MKNDYKGVIWTDHALQRLQERDISQSDAWVAFRRPDNSRYAKAKGAWVYDRVLNKKKIEVVAKKEDNKWIIISVWGDKINGEKVSQKGLLARILDKFL